MSRPQWNILHYYEGSDKPRLIGSFFADSDEWNYYVASLLERGATRLEIVRADLEEDGKQ